jgi:type IV pilus assembly protein PilF
MLAKVKCLTAAMLTLSLITACSTTSSHIAPDAATTKNINTAKINTQLGMAYMERHEMQHAKQKFLLALDEAPNIPETWYSMGYFMEATGDQAEAKKYFLKAVDIAPKQGDVQNNYGTFLCRSGDFHGAIDHFMIAVKDNEYLDTASAYENAGLCALKIPDKTLALQFFNKAVMQDPNHSFSLIESAQLDYDKGNYKEAKFRLAEYQAIASPTEQSMLLSRALGNRNQLSPDNQVA